MVGLEPSGGYDMEDQTNAWAHDKRMKQNRPFNGFGVMQPLDVRQREFGLGSQSRCHPTRFPKHGNPVRAWINGM